MNNAKELEKFRKQNEELKAELAQKDHLIKVIFANLSHEIRTPLNGILGFSEMLMQNNSLNDECKAHAGVITESSQMLLSILNDVFDLARIVSGKYKVYPEAFDLNDLLYELFVKYKQEAEAKNLQLFLENLISEELIVESSPAVIERILSKLIDNAIKFTKEGWIKLHYEHQGRCIVFTVEDTGIGIPEAIRHNLFDRFTVEEVSKSRKVAGSGLDLNLCKGLATLLGGEITYLPKEGEGSLFRISVPDHRMISKKQDGKSI
jgi:signal transduction histidine kinase